MGLDTVKKIAFVNSKGGVAKTTSVFQIAGVLGRRGDKVLVIDLDKQCNATSTFLMHSAKPNYTVLDFMLGRCNASTAVIPALWQSRSNATPKHYGVDCMAGDIQLQDEALLDNVDGETLDENLNDFIHQGEYDWVLIDMPPSNMHINDLAFQYMADYALIPFSSDEFSVAGYGQLMDLLDRAREKNPSLNVLGVFLSRYMKNCALDQYIRQSMMEFSAYLDCPIPLAVDIREATFYGRPISFYKPFSKSKTAYEKLIAEVERKIKQLQ